MLGRSALRRLREQERCVALGANPGSGPDLRIDSVSRENGVVEVDAIDVAVDEEARLESAGAADNGMKDVSFGVIPAVVVPQNVIRREIVASMSAKATKRTGFEPSPALPKARKPQASQGIGLRRSQCAQLKLTLGARRGTETRGQAACRA